MSWWERHPGMLQQEFEELAVAGMEPQIDDNALTKGRAIIHIQLDIRGMKHCGDIEYPDLYPYFRPVLLVPDLGFDLRHYNPCTGDICLLRRGTRYWQPSMTAAKHIQDMLPKWEAVASHSYGESRLEIEDRQAEPISVYYPTNPKQLIMMDSSWQLPSSVLSGQLKIVIPRQLQSITPICDFAAWVVDIFSHDNMAIKGVHAAKTIENWINYQGAYNTHNIRWTKLDAPPKGKNIEELISKLFISYPHIKSQIDQDIKKVRCGLHGLCFPEEAPSGKKRDGWLFIAYQYTQKFKKNKQLPSFWLVRVEPAGERDLYERIPELALLRNKTIAILGLGCLGAPSALSFARAGIGELRLLDGDYVSPGTTCRWPIGLKAAGGGKVKELSRFIRHNYPFTRINTDHYPEGIGEDFCLTIGECGTVYDQMTCLLKLIEGSDLIYDATAEEGVNHLISDLAREHKIPYISVSARAGGWGGHVLRISPGKSKGCYLCFLHALEDGSISQPPYDPEGDELQPAGCGDVTFRAAGFDVEEISLAGVRMAVSTLNEGMDKSYPRISHDVGILSLRRDGEAVFPQWETIHLQKNIKCERCKD